MEQTKEFIYDIEVMAHDFIVAIKERGTDQRFLYMEDDRYNISIPGVTILTKAQLIKFLKVAKFNIYGYNNYGYDDVILSNWATGMGYGEIKTLNDMIINGTPARELPKPFRIKSLDVKQQSDPNSSLKRYEAGKGGNVVEAKEFFNIDRPLTKDELEAHILPYVFNDVISTEAYLDDRQDYFTSKRKLIEMTGNSENAMAWNTTTIAGNYLVPEKGMIPDVFKVEGIETLPAKVGEAFITFLRNGNPFAPMSVEVEAFDHTLTFGLGGLHTQHNTATTWENVKTADVTSMYPSIIIRDMLLGPVTNKFRALVIERIKNKIANPGLASVQKIIINSVYGLLKSKFSNLFAPRVAISVTFSGQIALYNLGKMLFDAGATIVQLNTDGVYYLDNGKDLSNVFEAWEKQFELSLEAGEFNKLIQKNVNSYIAFKPNGKLKTKGTDFNNVTNIKPLNMNTAPIINKALFNFLTTGEAIDDFIDNSDDVAAFYFVADKINASFVKDALTGQKVQNINRVIATKTGTKLVKVRLRNGEESEGNFNDFPDFLTIHNESNTSFPTGTEVDREYYKIVAKKKAMAWTDINDLVLNELTEHALYYHRNGLKVIPISKGSKAPLMKFAGVKPFTSEADIIAYFMFNDVNLAIATSNLTVVDVDNHTGDGLSHLLREFGELEPTLEATTASGGKHFVYANRTNTQIVGFRDNVDIKANTNNYILVAPSTTSKGVYKWDNLDMTKAFKGQVAKMKTKDPLLTAIKESKKVVKLAPEVDQREGSEMTELALVQLKQRGLEFLEAAQYTGRNNELFKLASWASRNTGLHGEDMVSYLNGFNSQLPEPLPSNEVNTIARKFK